MDRFPAELVDRVFYFACTDGGRTANALRLASRQLHAIATPYRLRTVAVAGIAAIDQLLDVLEQSPPDAAIIEHLFISDKPRSYTEHAPAPRVPWRPRVAPDFTRNNARGVIERRALELDRDEAYKFSPLFKAVVERASPHLRSLAVVVCNREGRHFIGALSSLKLPHVCAVSLRGLNLASTYHIAAPACMPALRDITLDVPIDHLHIIKGLLKVSNNLQRVEVHGLHASHTLWDWMFDLHRAGGPIQYHFYPRRPSPPRHTYNHVDLGTERVFRMRIERFDDGGSIRVHAMMDRQLTFSEWKARWEHQTWLAA
jgi:hypothetical protein